VTCLELFDKVLDDRQQHLVAAAQDENLLYGIRFEPAGRCKRRIRVVVSRRAVEVVSRPGLADKRRNQVTSRVHLFLAVVFIERRPRRNDGRAGERLLQLELLDGRVRVREVRQDADSQVPARRVAAQEDLRRAMARLVEDVAQRLDSLRELRRVPRVRRRPCPQRATRRRRRPRT